MDLSWPSGLGTPKRILMVRLLPHLLQWPSKSTYLPQEWRMAIRFSVSLRVLGMITRRSTKGSATSDASKPPALSASSAPARSTPQKPNRGITCAQQEGYILPLLEKKPALMRTGWPKFGTGNFECFHNLTSLPCPVRRPAMRAILRTQHQARKMAVRQEIMEPPTFQCFANLKSEMTCDNPTRLFQAKWHIVITYHHMSEHVTKRCQWNRAMPM